MNDFVAATGPDTRAGRPDREPTARELAAIDAEWPLIAAELDVVAAEIAVLASEGPVTALALRRLTNAYRHAEAVAARLSTPRQVVA